MKLMNEEIRMNEQVSRIKLMLMDLDLDEIERINKFIEILKKTK